MANMHDNQNRAGARKSGRDGEPRIVKPEERFDHMPHTQHYPVEDVLVDLLEVSHVTAVSADATVTAVTAVAFTVSRYLFCRERL